jgi:hypothetical protein
MRITPLTRWPAYASIGWLGCFVVTHILAAGFAPEDPDGPATQAVYVWYNVVLIAIAAVGAVAVLATIRPWGERARRWMLLVPLGFGSALLVLRGLPGLVENLVMVTGLRRGGLMGPDEGLSTGELWTGVAINTYFFVGALLLVPATLAYARRSHREPDRRQAVDTAAIDGCAG